MAAQEEPENKCYKNHGKTKQLPHGEHAPEKPELGIRFSEEFHQKSQYTIAAEKQANHGAWAESEIFEHPENKEQ
jgi:hypothetical protein